MMILIGEQASGKSTIAKTIFFCKSISDEFKLYVIQKVVNRILFLFKYASYSYEKEVRICYQFPEIDKSFKHTNQLDKKLYVITDFVIPFKEIILGPKFINRSDVVPYFQERIDMMCNKLCLDKPQITFSDIVYV